MPWERGANQKKINSEKNNAGNPEVRAAFRINLNVNSIQMRSMPSNFHAELLRKFVKIEFSCSHYQFLLSFFHNGNIVRKSASREHFVAKLSLQKSVDLLS